MLILWETLLLRAFAGLILPDEGKMIIDGQELTPHHRFPDSMGIIIENLSFWPFMTGKNALRVISSIKKVVGDERIVETMNRVGLDPSDRRIIKKYSLGMVQKLAIAQAIMEDPDLLLLDEPTNSLDEKSRRIFYNIVHDEVDRGKTIIMASHIREDLEQCCKRILQIDNGILIN